MAFFFLKKTAQKVRRTFTKIAAVNIINSVKRAIFFKRKRLPLGQKYVFSRDNQKIFFKRKRFPLEQKQQKTSKEIEGYLSKGNGFLLVKTKQFRRHFRKKIQVETASS